MFETTRVPSFLTVLIAVFALAACAGSPAQAARGHILSRSFGVAGGGDGQLQGPEGIAVNEETGDVYVVDAGNKRVEYFSSTGTYLGQFNGSGLLSGEDKAAGSGGRSWEHETGQFTEPTGIAIDNSKDPSDPSRGDVYVEAGYYLNGQDGIYVVDKFSATGEYIAQIALPRAALYLETHGITIGSQGELAVAIRSSEISVDEDNVDEFDDAVINQLQASVVTSSFPVNGFLTKGLAFGPHNSFLLQAQTGFGTYLLEIMSGDQNNDRIFSSEVAFNGVSVEQGTEDVYVYRGGLVSRLATGGSFEVEQFGAEDLPNENCEVVSRPACVGGLAVDSATGGVYVSVGPSNVVDEFELEPPAVPRIEEESVADVTSGSATFAATINPRALSGEAGSTYRFEYGPCATPSTCSSSGYAESVPVPDGSLSGDFEPHAVTVHPQDLLAATKYHFRVVAQNAHGVGEGAERVFVTQPAGGFGGLPDNREWELVSPPNKHGALISPIGEVGLAQASADGQRLAYLTDTPTETQPQSYTNEVQVLSTRGSQSWSSLDLSAGLHESPTGFSVGAGEEYRAFSTDLSQAVLQPFGVFEKSISQDASEPTAFLHNDYSGEAPCQRSCDQPLVTGCPVTGEECTPSVEAHADVPAGTIFGTECEGSIICGPVFVGASGDLAHVVLHSSASLTGGSQVKNGLYEWTAGKLTLVSVLPHGKVLPAAGFGVLGSHDDERHAIAEDGSRVVWSEFAGERHLYVRDVSDQETVQLDVVQSGASGSGTAVPVFQTASSDDSRVFFTDEQRLTVDSGAVNGAPDLYECVLVSGPTGIACELSDLTPANGSVDANVLGEVIGASEDGSYVYFVANGVYTEHAQPGNCDGSGNAGESCNLYVRHEGTTRLVAVLSGADEPDWSDLPGLTGRVSPDGQWLAFMSQRSLTGYDNRDAVSGQPDEEVYLYHASGEGALVCASCNPTGARPRGVEYGPLDFQEGGIAGGDRVWHHNQWLAANIPGWTPYRLVDALYQSRYLSNSGRLFFNSADALVPQDTNGNEDVYEYEPSGAGNCTTASITFGEGSDGCVGLISSGASPEESAFLDASETGGDVFFLTSAKLVPQDYDVSRDVYDAHECSNTASCFAPVAAAPPACTTAEACRAAPTPQPAIFGAPSSATFTGAGNVTPETRLTGAAKQKSLTRAQKLAVALRTCKRKRQKARARCEREARRRYGSARTDGSSTKKKGR
jgi:hypothetical protein